MLVKDFLAEHDAITSRWGVYDGFFASLVAYVEEIFSVSGEQGRKITGAAMMKHDAKILLCEKIVVISEKCRGYATVEEDEAFFSLIKFTKSKTERMADVTLLTKAKGLRDNVLPRLAELAEYDLEAGEVEELRELTDAFEAIYTVPEGQIKDRAARTARLRELFKLTDAVLKTIDAIVLTAREREQDFVSGYRLRRVVPKLAYRRRALELRVVDEATGEGVAKAVVVMTLKDGDEHEKPIRKKTGMKGGVVMNNLRDGEWMYEVLFGGFATGRGVFFVNKGEMTRVVVGLVKSEE